MIIDSLFKIFKISYSDKWISEGGSLKKLWSSAYFADDLNSGFKESKDEIKSIVVLSKLKYWL